MDGKFKPDLINVVEMRQSNTYQTLEQVPEALRGKVKNLIEICENGSRLKKR